MLILGLNLGHDPSAALVDQDGHVHAATHEARYTRLKKERRFPANAIASALRAAKCDAADVDIVAYSSYEPDDLALIRDKFLCGVGDMRRAPRELIEGQLHQLGIRPTEIVREEHHFVHACAAMRACPTPDPLIVTSDGYGDGISFTIRRAESGRVPSSCLMKAPVNASLGLVYQYVTGGLGYSMLSEEWKVLGLEPYGDPQGAACLFEDLHDGHVGIAEWNTTALERWSFMAGDESPSSSRELRDSLRRYLELRVPQFDRRDVASALQDYLEGRVLGELERFGGTEQTALALGGGTFLNVRLNRMLSELAWVSEVSVFPAAGDGGNSVGAALAYLQRTSELPPVHGVDNVYWGEGYSRLASGLQWGDGLLAKPAMAEDEVIEYLSSAIADGRVVAIFRGRGEYGPRALLHRSVVCKADRPDLHDMLNEQLRRDPVMPFGCSMLDSDAKFALGRVGALGPCLRFMIAAPLVRQDFGRQYRPVCHATREGGFSTRPHLVADGVTWPARLLASVRRRTGSSVILNTSFNMHGDPIAGTPSDAVAAFRQMAIPESVLLVADRVFSLPEIERLYGPAVRLTPRVRHGEPRRRREACVCVVRGAVADELCGLRASIKDLGLRIAAERHVGDEARAFLVVGSESSSLMDRWASAQSHRPTWLIETGACDLHVSGLLRQIFPNEIGGDIGSFADLLLWPGELSADAALSQLERESSLTLAGLLFPLRRLLRPAAEEFRSDRQLAAVFGTTARVKSAPGGRMYMYAPEGYRALQRLVAELASDIQAGNFLRCRESGLVLAYSPPRSCSDAELNAKVRAAVALGVDGLVAVDPRLSVTSAVRLEMIGRSHGLAITGGSGCLVRQRATRPLGVRSSVLGRFVNRFPGLEL